MSIGRIAKPHGLRGQVVVELWTNRTERLSPGEEVASDAGPLRILGASRHGQRWLVSFEGVEDREGAERLRSVVLLAEAVEDPDALWVHELVGSVVYDTAGVCHGAVVAVEANPASDLLVLESGALVPLRFVVSSGEGRIDVEVPAGLLD